MKKLILMTLAAALLTAGVADAGPFGLFGRGRRCGGCQAPTAHQPQAHPPQWASSPPVQPQPVLYATSYSGVGVPVDATAYRPITLGQPVPTCPTCPQR